MASHARHEWNRLGHRDTLAARAIIGALGMLVLIVAAQAPARAESWCAYPLWVHEWGVHVFAGDGAPAPGAVLPDYFRTPIAPAAQAPVTGPPVRTLPADGGERELPVLHFYSTGSLSSPIPLGLEIGFTHGAASAWFPEVDLLRSAADANGQAAQLIRLQLLMQRQPAERPPRPPLPADPTRQLVWDHLDLAPAPTHTPNRTKAAWVDTVRGFPALWVNSQKSSERFVFYEGKTQERPLLRIQRAADWSPSRRHLELHNLGSDPVADVFFVHREGGRAFVFFAPAIPAGQHAGFVLEDQAVAPAEFAAATRGRLTTLWVDASAPKPPESQHWDMDHCVMSRDPAVPFERAEGHRVYRAELDAIVGVWGARFFDADGTTILYREDTALLDRELPLSLYTDMYNYVVLRRLGLALWEHVAW